MRDRRNGTLLIALAVALLVLLGRDLDLGSWPGRIELSLAGLALVVGAVLVLVGRPR